MKAKAVPESGANKVKDIPAVGVPENTIIVAGTPLEIKPMKLKYVRNGTANFYKLIENVSLIDIMQLESGAFGENDDRDGDKAVMDWIIAVTDNEQFVTEHYDEFDMEQVYRLLEIFKRINKFVKNEGDSKNAKTPEAEE